MTKIKAIPANSRRPFRAGIIRIYRQRIADHKKEEDRIFSQACKHLGIDEQSNRGTTLFDFLFNGGFGDTKTPSKVEKVLWPVGAAVKSSVTSGSKSTEVPSQTIASQDLPTTVSATDAWQKP